jgi:hypothetical protein
MRGRKPGRVIIHTKNGVWDRSASTIELWADFGAAEAAKLILDFA